METVTVNARELREALLPLLLLADPDEKMVRRYLHKGRMVAALDGERAVGVAVVVPLFNGGWELKNLSVKEEDQRKGIGAALIEEIAVGLPQGNYLWVGTGVPGVPYYEKHGFRYSHTVRHFFTAHYPEPIYENGEQLVDMHYLKREL